MGVTTLQDQPITDRHTKAEGVQYARSRDFFKLNLPRNPKQLTLHESHMGNELNNENSLPEDSPTRPRFWAAPHRVPNTITRLADLSPLVHPGQGSPKRTLISDEEPEFAPEIDPCELSKPGPIIPKFEENLKPFYNDRRRLSSEYWDKYEATDYEDASLITKSILLDQWILSETPKSAWGQDMNLVWFCGWKYFQLWKHTQDIAHIKSAAEYFRELSKLNSDPGSYLMSQQEIARVQRKLMRCYRHIYDATQEIEYLDKALIVGETCLKMPGCPPHRREKVFWGLLLCVRDNQSLLSQRNQEVSLAMPERLLSFITEYTSWMSKPFPDQCTALDDSYILQNISPTHLMNIGDTLYQHYECYPNLHDNKSTIFLDFAIAFQQYALDRTRTKVEDKDYVPWTLQLIRSLTQRHRRTLTDATKTRDLGQAKTLLEGLNNDSASRSPKDKAWTEHWQSVHLLLSYQPFSEGSLETLNNALEHSTNAVRDGWELLSNATKDDAPAISADLLSWGYHFEEVLVRKLQYHLDRGEDDGCVAVRDIMKRLLTKLSTANEKINSADRWIGKAQALMSNAWLKYVEYCSISRKKPGENDPGWVGWEQRRKKLLDDAILEGMQALFRAQDISKAASEANSHVEDNVYLCLSTFHLARYLHLLQPKDFPEPAKDGLGDTCGSVDEKSKDDNDSDLNRASRYSRIAMNRATKHSYATIQERHFFLRTCQSRVAVLIQTFRRTGHPVHLRDAIQYQEEAVKYSSADRLLCATYTIALGQYTQLLLEDPEDPEVGTNSKGNNAAIDNPTLLKRTESVSKAYQVLLEYGDPQAIVSAVDCLTSLCTALYKDYGTGNLSKPTEKHRKLLDTAIAMATGALKIQESFPPDQVSLLATLSEAHEARATTKCDELPTAIKYAQEALAAAKRSLRAMTFERAELNYHLGLMLFSLHKGDLKENGETVLEPLLECLEDKQAPAIFRLKSTVSAAVVLEGLEDWPRLYRYVESAMHILPHLSLRSMPRRDQQQVLKSVSGLGSIAAAAALQIDGESATTKALMFIESGRDLITGNYFATRADVGALRRANSDLCEKYEAMVHEWQSAGIDRGTLQAVDTSRQPHRWGGTLSRIREWTLHKFRWPERFNDVVKLIRKIPAFTKFMMPPEVLDLTEAAGNGTIVVVNVARWRCDALIVRNDGVELCKLEHLKASDIDYHFPNAAGRQKITDRNPLDHFAKNESAWVWMWRTIAKPVLDIPTLKYTEDSTSRDKVKQGDPSRRVWWVMTGNSCKLPVHAAGDDGVITGRRSRVCHYVISSYLTSIKALIFARMQFKRRGELNEVGPPEALLCALPRTERDVEWGLTPLKGVQNEITEIDRKLSDAVYAGGVKGREHVKTWRDNPQAQSVINALSPLNTTVPNTSIFHFAGHGFASDTDPSASGIYLYDEQLTVTKLLEAKVYETAPTLAYLSACSTGSTALLLDEGVHIMSGFVAAGFMNVVGTLWSVDDSISHSIAVQFYENWVAVGLEPSKVAWALHQAVNTVGLQTGSSPEDWACVVHTGI